jgi:nucleolar complex protein 3
MFIFSPHAKLREIVKINLDRLFKGDKKGQVSLLVVRSINHHLKVKKREKVRPEMLNVLLALKLYHLENPKDIATAHLQASREKKHREEMSKKERKFNKMRAKLDKELLETKAEESTKTRLRFATDISNMLFAVYFRLIKDPTGNGQSSIMINRALLRPVLTGLAKFGHLMSIDYFQVIYFRICINSLHNFPPALCCKSYFVHFCFF